jgi:hypothetical protein
MVPSMVTDGKFVTSGEHRQPRPPRGGDGHQSRCATHPDLSPSGCCRREGVRSAVCAVDDALRSLLNPRFAQRRAHMMQCVQTSLAPPRATGLQSLGLCGPYIDMDEARHEDPRSNHLGAAEGGVASMALQCTLSYACPKAVEQWLCAALALISVGCCRRGGPAGASGTESRLENCPGVSKPRETRGLDASACELLRRARVHASGVRAREIGADASVSESCGAACAPSTLCLSSCERGCNREASDGHLHVTPHE